MQNVETQPTRLPRVKTGISGLDTILHGGLLKGGSYLLLGASGTGKTVISNQLAFYHARTGGHIVYITLLAESHSRMLNHLQTFQFFTTEPVARTLYYISALAELERSGLTGVLELVRRTLISHRATLLILDGLDSIQMLAESPFAFKRFVKDLQVAADTTGCTAVLLSDDNASSHTEQILMDGVIRLVYKTVRMRTVREVEILKFRGSAYLEGRHAFTISSEGAIVYPRIEALLTDRPPLAPEQEKYVSTGIDGLDKMLGGGLLTGSTTLLFGTPGTGKTSLGLHFLAAGAKLGEAGLHFGFYEPPARLISKGEKLGLGIAHYAQEGLIELMWQPPIPLPLDALAQRLIGVIEQRNVKRIFLDGMEGFLESAFYAERANSFFSALINELRSRLITVIFTVQSNDLVSPTVTLPLTGVSTVGENIIYMRYVELKSNLRRLVSVIKVRESQHDPAIHEFDITQHGIEIASPLRNAEATLSGTAHVPDSGSHGNTHGTEPGAA
jgi:circadian clock protein KaiC